MNDVEQVQISTRKEEDNLKIWTTQRVCQMHTGGVAGLISLVLQASMPGVTMRAAYAEGNALGKGPVVMHIRHKSSRYDLSDWAAAHMIHDRKALNRPFFWEQFYV